MHVPALAVCILAPQMWTYFVNTAPEPGVGLSAVAEDVSTLMQVGVQLSPANSSPPALSSRTHVLAEPQPKGHHATGAAAGLAVSQQREADARASVNSTDWSLALDHHFRPHLGVSREVVSFAIYLKNFFGMKIPKNLFTVDIVLTLSWTDPRVAKLVPENATDMTICPAQARKTLWLPDIVVANRAIKGKERISTAIQIHKDGTVLKTERLLLRVKQHFDVTAFPFDHQSPK